jgi:hypothetical protein
MPTIRIDYDDAKLADSDVLAVSNAVRDIVQEITGIEDTFVYAQSPHIKLKVAPLEIVVQMSATKIVDVDELFGKIQERLSAWKKETRFSFPINLTLMPMHWKFEVNI